MPPMTHVNAIPPHRCLSSRTSSPAGSTSWRTSTRWGRLRHRRRVIVHGPGRRAGSLQRRHGRMSIACRTPRFWLLRQRPGLRFFNECAETAPSTPGQVGGTPAVLKYLLAKGLIDGTTLTVTGAGGRWGSACSPGLGRRRSICPWQEPWPEQGRGADFCIRARAGDRRGHTPLPACVPQHYFHHKRTTPALTRPLTPPPPNMQARLWPRTWRPCPSSGKGRTSSCPSRAQSSPRCVATGSKQEPRNCRGTSTGRLHEFQVPKLIEPGRTLAFLHIHCTNALTHPYP